MNPTPRFRPIEQVKPELHAAEAALHTAIHQAVSHAEACLGLGFAAGEVISLLSRRGMFAEAAELSQVAATQLALQQEFWESRAATDRANYADFVDKAEGEARGEPDYLRDASDVV
jgi:hypothetical protein